MLSEGLFFGGSVDLLIVPEPRFRIAVEWRVPASGEAVEAVNAEIMSASAELIAASQKAMDTSDAGEVSN